MKKYNDVQTRIILSALSDADFVTAQSSQRSLTAREKSLIALAAEVRRLQKIEEAARLVIQDAGLGRMDYEVSPKPFEALEELLK
jgi:hypothetical protein